MAESWESRKKRLEQIRKGFPEGLRGIPIRYVEDVAGLSEPALEALDMAFRKESVHIPRALEYLRNNLFISLEELQKRSKPPKLGRRPLSGKSPALEGSRIPDSSKKDRESLAELLLACYPSMPSLTAESMAGSEVMKEALAVVTTTREAIESDHAQSDFVILSLLTLFIESKKQILEIVRNSPAFQKALDLSNLAVDQ